MSTNFIYAAMYLFLDLVRWLILGRIILSWVVKDLSHPAISFLYEITEPIIAPFRKILEKLNLLGTFDFSSLMALLFIQFLRIMLNAVI